MQMASRRFDCWINFRNIPFLCSLFFIYPGFGLKSRTNAKQAPKSLAQNLKAHMLHALRLILPMLRRLLMQKLLLLDQQPAHQKVVTSALRVLRPYRQAQPVQKLFHVWHVSLDGVHDPVFRNELLRRGVDAVHAKPDLASGPERENARVIHDNIVYKIKHLQIHA